MSNIIITGKDLSLIHILLQNRIFLRRYVWNFENTGQKKSSGKVFDCGILCAKG